MFGKIPCPQKVWKFIIKGSGLQRKIRLVSAPVGRGSWPWWEMGRSPSKQILESKCVSRQLLDGLHEKEGGCLSGEDAWSPQGVSFEGQLAETGRHE